MRILHLSPKSFFLRLIEKINKFLEHSILSDVYKLLISLEHAPVFATLAIFTDLKQNVIKFMGEIS